MKKIIAFCCLAVFATAGSNACRAQQAGAAPYAMFRGDAKHTGIYPSAEVSNTPHVKWKFKTNGFVTSSPAIDGTKIYFGSDDSTLYCLDTNNANVIWKFKTGGAVNSSPALTNGLILFGSHDGNFYALNAATGKVKWTFATPGEKLFSGKHLHGQVPADSMFVDRWDFWLSSPVIDNNKVYFGSGAGYVYALDIKTGKQQWEFKTDGIVHSSPALAYGNLYIGGWDTYMHALNATTGKEVWKYKTGVDEDKHNQTGITGSAIVADNMVYFGCRDSYVYALDALTGKEVWKKFNDHGWVSITPAIYGDKLIYSSGSSTRFAALNKKTGDSVYQTSIGTATFASPSIAGTTVYQGTFKGTMNAIDVNTGKTKWVFKTDAAIADKYGVLNPDLSYNGDKVEEAIKNSGGKLRPVDFGLTLGAILSSPVIKEKVIYFGSSDGNLYALE